MQVEVIRMNDKFMKDLAATFKPGTSALFVLVRKATPDKVLEELSKHASDRDRGEDELFPVRNRLIGGCPGMTNGLPPDPLFARHHCRLPCHPGRGDAFTPLRGLAGWFAS